MVQKITITCPIPRLLKINHCRPGGTVYGPENYYNFPYPSLLRGRCTFLEIVFVGQCEVFVCRDLVHFFFSLGRKAHRSANEVPIL